MIRFVLFCVVALAFPPLLMGQEGGGGARLTLQQIIAVAEPSIVIAGPSFLLAVLAKYVTWVRNWSTGEKRAFVILGSVGLALGFLALEKSLSMETVSALFAALAGLAGGLATVTTVALVKADQK